MKTNSQNSLAKTDDLSLDDESVANYLMEHPDFFATHEDLLLNLRISHKSGQAISLLERQVSLLRRKNDETQDKRPCSRKDHQALRDGIAQFDYEHSPRRIPLGEYRRL